MKVVKRSERMQCYMSSDTVDTARCNKKETSPVWKNYIYKLF